MAATKKAKNSVSHTFTSKAISSSDDMKISVGSANLDLEGIKGDLKNLLKSPNPFSLYMNTTKIKEKFWEFINELTHIITESFSLEDKNWLVFQLYQDAKYSRVWFDLIEWYLKDVKQFDVLNYFYFVFLVKKEKRYIAQALIQLAKWKKEQEIERNIPWVNIRKAASIFQELWLAKIKIAKKFLVEDRPEVYLNKVFIALNRENKDFILELFKLEVNSTNFTFDVMVQAVQRIIMSYSHDEKAIKYVNKKEFRELKHQLDELIGDYVITKRSWFYDHLNSVMKAQEEEFKVEKEYFWLYIKTEIIDKYYAELKNLFYYHSANEFRIKETWSKLKGKFNNDVTEGQYVEQIKWLVELKSLILDLNGNLFSTFINPIIFSTVSERINVSRNDMNKLKYILLYIISDNYHEYKVMYKFFNQLEVFMNYDGTAQVSERLKVYFSFVIVLAIVWVASYLYLPIWVFLGIALLVLMQFIDSFYSDNYYKMRWNAGIKFFAVAFLAVSWYFWFQNFDATEQDMKELTSKIEVMWTLPAKEVIDDSYKYLKVSVTNIKSMLEENLNEEIPNTFDNSYINE